MFRRGQSCGGGYSSLGYLFGGDDKPKPRAVRPNHRGQSKSFQEQPVKEQYNSSGYGSKSPYDSTSSVVSPENERPAAGKVYHDEIHMDRTNNNYHRADGQNCGNFITVSSLLLTVL